MSTFGQALASLYEEMRADRSKRAQSASDRIERVAQIARDTQNLLNAYSRDRTARAEEFKAMSQDLRARLSASAKSLKDDISALKAEARDEANARARRREESSMDLHMRLSAFSEALKTDIATQFSLARKARVQAQNVQELAGSVVETTVNFLTKKEKTATKRARKRDPGPDVAGAAITTSEAAAKSTDNSGTAT